MSRFFKQSKFYSRFGLAVLALVIIVVGNLVQQRVLKVRAAIQVLLVSNTALPFGTVFPGQTFNQAYTVSLDTSATSSSYTTILAPVNGFFNLCPFLQLSNSDAPTEPDSLSLAALIKPGDVVDVWSVKLNVPGVSGQVAQDHTGGIVVSAGDFACAITVTDDLSQNPGGEGGGTGTIFDVPPGSGPGGNGGGNTNNVISNNNPVNPNPPGLVAGDFTDNSDSGQSSNPEPQVLGAATGLPKTGAGLDYLVFLGLVSLLLAKKFKHVL